MDKPTSNGNIGTTDTTHLDGEAVAIRYVELSVAAGLLWERNPKRHDIGALAESLEQHGFRDPPAFDANLTNQQGGQGGIVYGNGRVEALASMYSQKRTPPRGVLTHRVNGAWYLPVKFGLDAASKQAAEAFGIDHNSIGLLGGDLGFVEQMGIYDEAVLQPLMLELAEFNAPLVSFDYGDFEPYGEPPEDQGAQIDRAAELQEVWQVARGDLWIIPSVTGDGQHRLLCGDSTVRDDVERLMDGERAEMVFTDPPYGVDYRGGHFHSGNVNIVRERPALNGDTSDIYKEFIPVMIEYVDGPCYVWFAASRARSLYNAAYAEGCEIHAMIVWHKINATYAAMNAQYKQRHEPCLYFKPRGSTLRWIGASDEATLWEIKRDAVNDMDPTQKPIELALKAIGNHAANTILDPFGGSGTTMVAAEQLGRLCRMVEIEPKYCSVILQRMADLGLTPERVE